MCSRDVFHLLRALHLRQPNAIHTIFIYFKVNGLIFIPLSIDNNVLLATCKCLQFNKITEVIFPALFNLKCTIYTCHKGGLYQKYVYLQIKVGKPKYVKSLSESLQEMKQFMKTNLSENEYKFIKMAFKKIMNNMLDVSTFIRRDYLLFSHYSRGFKYFTIMHTVTHHYHSHVYLYNISMTQIFTMKITRIKFGRIPCFF